MFSCDHPSKRHGQRWPSRSWESCTPAGSSVLLVDNCCHHGNQCGAISSAVTSMSGGHTLKYVLSGNGRFF